MIRQLDVTPLSSSSRIRRKTSATVPGHRMQQQLRTFLLNSSSILLLLFLLSSLPDTTASRDPADPNDVMQIKFLEVPIPGSSTGAVATFDTTLLHPNTTIWYLVLPAVLPPRLTINITKTQKNYNSLRDGSGSSTQNHWITLYDQHDPVTSQLMPLPLSENINIQLKLSLTSDHIESGWYLVVQFAQDRIHQSWKIVPTLASPLIDRPILPVVSFQQYPAVKDSGPLFWGTSPIDLGPDYSIPDANTPQVFGPLQVQAGVLVFTFLVTTQAESTSLPLATRGMILFNSTYNGHNLATDAANVEWISGVATRFTMPQLTDEYYAQEKWNMSFFTRVDTSASTTILNSKPDFILTLVLPRRLLSWRLNFDNASYPPGTAGCDSSLCAWCCNATSGFDDSHPQFLYDYVIPQDAINWTSSISGTTIINPIGGWLDLKFGGGYGEVNVVVNTRSSGEYPLPLQYINNFNTTRYWIPFPPQDYFFTITITTPSQYLRIEIQRWQKKLNLTEVEVMYDTYEHELRNASKNLTLTTGGGGASVSPPIVLEETDLKYLALRRFDQSTIGSTSNGVPLISMTPSPVIRPSEKITVSMKATTSNTGGNQQLPSSSPLPPIPPPPVSHDLHMIVSQPNPFFFLPNENMYGIIYLPDGGMIQIDSPAAVTVDVTDIQGESLVKGMEDLSPLSTYSYSILQSYGTSCAPPQCTPYCQLYNRTSQEWLSLDIVHEIDTTTQQIRCSTSIPGTLGVFMKRIIRPSGPASDVSSSAELHYGQQKNDLALVIALIVVAGLLFIIMFIGGFFAFLRETRQMKAQIDALKRSMKESQLESLNDDHDDNMEMGADTEYYLAHSNRNSSSDGGGGGAPLIGGGDGDVTNGDSLEYGGDVTGVGTGHIIHDGAVPLESPSLYIDSPSIMYTQHRTSTALWNYSPANSPLATATTPGPSRPLTATSPMPLLASAYSSRRPLPMTTTRAVFISPPSPRISHLPKSMQPLTDEELAWHIRHS